MSADPNSMMTPQWCLVLDVAKFKYSSLYADGARSDEWELIKPVGDWPVGKKVTLAELHARLFPRGGKGIV